jgi:hypothetical protein
VISIKEAKWLRLFEREGGGSKREGKGRKEESGKGKWNCVLWGGPKRNGKMAR